MADISDVTLIEEKEDGTTVTTKYDIKDEIAREQLNAIPDGTYPDMTVGGVMSSDGSTDSTPYLYRASGGGVEVGTVEEDSIVGGTVAFNQLAGKYTSGTTTNGVTFTPNDDGSVSVSGTASATAIQYIPNPDNVMAIVGHKYFACGCPIGGSSATWQLSIRVNSASTLVGSDYGSGAIFAFTTSTANDRFSLIMRVVNGTTINAKFIPQLFDLTQMFGSAVADMIYNMETANVGAGVAFFRSLFPNDYYEYNTGELKSVEGLQSHDMVGKNLLENTGTSNTVNGVTFTFNSDGTVTVNGTATALYDRPVNNRIDDLLAGNYIFSGGAEGTGATNMYLHIRNKNGQIRYIANNNDNEVPFTVTNDDYEIRCAIRVNSGQTYNNAVFKPMIRNALATDSFYEPYVKHSYPLDSSLTLRGIPKLDASNNLYYDGDVYTADGKVERKYGIRAYQSGDESLTDAITDGTNTVYMLSTPTEETAQAYTEYQKVSKYGTEEYVSTSIVPVGHVTKYPADIVSKVDGLPSDFSTLIAPTEASMKASKAYTANDLIIVNNQLYRATTSIASGATLTVGTNVVACTIASLIKGLL